MTVVVVGLDHRSVPLELLERVAIPSERIADALDYLTKSDHITEAVVLSTCMRTEVYVDAARFHGAVGDVRSMLSHFADVSVEEFSPYLVELFDEAAYRRLFRVAAGLESAVVGETEILGQVARAWEAAREHGASRTVLGSLFRHAVGVGKRARTDTAVARGITSIAQAAVVMAGEQLGGLEDKRVLVLGAGEMGEGMALTLSLTNGVGDVVVCNRTPERATALASQVGGRAVPFASLRDELSHADLLLTSTGATDTVLTATDIREAQAVHHDPLVIVDMGVPRDVEPAAAEVDGVTILDLDDLERFADVGRAARTKEIDQVQQIVDEELREFIHDINARSVTPIVRAMRERAEGVRARELDRHNLTEEQREAVEKVTNALIAKLLHEPTTRLKDAAGTADGERLAEAIRYLLDL